MSDRRLTFSPDFVRNYERLKKRYRQIGKDVRPILDQLRQGETPGDQVPDVGYTVYKVRVRNRSAQSGKSGGFRII